MSTVYDITAYGANFTRGYNSFVFTNFSTLNSTSYYDDGSWSFKFLAYGPYSMTSSGTYYGMGGMNPVITGTTIRSTTSTHYHGAITYYYSSSIKTSAIYATLTNTGVNSAYNSNSVYTSQTYSANNDTPTAQTYSYRTSVYISVTGQVQTTGTTYLTRSSTSATQYLTRSSTSGYSGKSSSSKSIETSTWV